MRCQNCNGTEIQGLCRNCGIIGPIDSIIARTVAEKFHGIKIPPKRFGKTGTNDFIVVVANKLLDVVHLARKNHAADLDPVNALDSLTIMRRRVGWPGSERFRAERARDPIAERSTRGCDARFGGSQVIKTFFNFLFRRRACNAMPLYRPNECGARRRERLCQKRVIRAQLLDKIRRSMKGSQ